MSLVDVLVTDDVYHTCLHQALSTEREEVLGMLMGRITADRRAILWAASIVPRSDKRPDRVEISPEQLCAVAEEAERIGEAIGERTRTIGWYHSHPHITPYPSHVDLATQGMCQMMEKCWVGLIFSVFNADKKTHRNRITLHCFATLVDGTSHHHIKVPVRVVPASYVVAAPPEALRVLRVLPEQLAAEMAASNAAARERVSAQPGVTAAALRLYDELAAMALVESQFQMTQLLVAEGAAAGAAITRAQEQRVEELMAVLTALEEEGERLERQLAKRTLRS
jgi:BRCA1/BRCA2-containing complex subunit 3